LEGRPRVPCAKINTGKHRRKLWDGAPECHVPQGSRPRRRTPVGSRKQKTKGSAIKPYIRPRSACNWTSRSQGDNSLRSVSYQSQFSLVTTTPHRPATRSRELRGKVVSTVTLQNYKCQRTTLLGSQVPEQRSSKTSTVRDHETNQATHPF